MDLTTTASAFLVAFLATCMGPRQSAGAGAPVLRVEGELRSVRWVDAAYGAGSRRESRCEGAEIRDGVAATLEVPARVSNLRVLATGTRDIERVVLEVTGPQGVVSCGASERFGAPAMVTLDAAPGTYTVRLGVHDSGTIPVIRATPRVGVTTRADAPVVATLLEGHEPQQLLAFDGARLRVAGSRGREAWLAAAEVVPGCDGHVRADPSYGVDVVPGQPTLTLLALPDGDQQLTLLIQGPDGAWVCVARRALPRITFEPALPGRYRVWVGFAERRNAGYTFVASADPEDDPLEPALDAMTAEVTEDLRRLHIARRAELASEPRGDLGVWHLPLRLRRHWCYGVLFRATSEETVRDVRLLVPSDTRGRRAHPSQRAMWTGEWCTREPERSGATLELRGEGDFVLELHGRAMRPAEVRAMRRADDEMFDHAACRVCAAERFECQRRGFGDCAGRFQQCVRARDASPRHCSF